MKTKTIELYEFSELSDKVKAKVLDRERYINVEGIQWYDFVFEEWNTKLSELGFPDADISFTGFYSQGDGASFTCKGVDVPLFIAKQNSKDRFKALLTDIEAERIELIASVDRIDHHYSHAYTVKANTELYYLEDQEPEYSLEQLEGELCNFITETVRTLSRLIYRELEKEYEGLTSDEAVKDCIESNEYTFRANGEMEND